MQAAEEQFLIHHEIIPAPIHNLGVLLLFQGEIRLSAVPIAAATAATYIDVVCSGSREYIVSHGTEARGFKCRRDLGSQSLQCEGCTCRQGVAYGLVGMRIRRCEHDGNGVADCALKPIEKIGAFSWVI